MLFINKSLKFNTLFSLFNKKLINFFKGKIAYREISYINIDFIGSFFLNLKENLLLFLVDVLR
jgi:hypothetical protein